MCHLEEHLCVIGPLCNIASQIEFNHNTSLKQRTETELLCYELKKRETKLENQLDLQCR